MAQTFIRALAVTVSNRAAAGIYPDRSGPVLVELLRSAGCAVVDGPLVIPDVASDQRFLWVRGLDQKRFVASMLSVPLTWHEATVGVLNVQTEVRREFTGAPV